MSQENKEGGAATVIEPESIHEPGAETLEGNIELEEVELENPPLAGHPADEPAASEDDDEYPDGEIPPFVAAALNSLGFGLGRATRVNLRKAEPFQDIEFRAVELAAPGAVLCKFPGSEFERRLNEWVASKTEVRIDYHCPNRKDEGGDCDSEWHEYCLITNGEEYLHWFLATKMSTSGGIWLDERKVEETDEATTISRAVPGGDTADTAELRPTESDPV